MLVAVSTTQTIVGALVGVGFASQADIKWAWDNDGASIAQIAASWGIAPIIAGCFAAIVFLTVKYTVILASSVMSWLWSGWLIVC